MRRRSRVLASVLCVAAAVTALIWSRLKDTLREPASSGHAAWLPTEHAVPVDSADPSSSSARGAAPAFAADEAETTEIEDPFWPDLRPPQEFPLPHDLSSPGEGPPTMVFYGTLLRGMPFALVGVPGGVSVTVGPGDSLGGGIVEAVTLEGVIYRVGGLVHEIGRSSR